METLSSSVPTLQLQRHPSTTTTKSSLFKPPASHVAHLRSGLHNKTSRTTSSVRPASTLTSPVRPSAPASSLTHASPSLHTKPSTGYAAALLDIPRCHNTLEAVHKDVRSLSRLLNDLRAILVDDDATKGKVVKELMEKGRFHKHLVMVVKLLIQKKKVGMVKEVLNEFERIYDELHGIKVVLVSSARKMEEGEVVGIAKKVQKMSGAIKVKGTGVHGLKLLKRNSSSFKPCLDGLKLLGPDAELNHSQISKFSKRDTEAYPRNKWQRSLAYRCSFSAFGCRLSGKIIHIVQIDH